MSGMSAVGGTVATALTCDKASNVQAFIFIGLQQWPFFIRFRIAGRKWKHISIRAYCAVKIPAFLASEPATKFIPGAMAIFNSIIL